MQRETCNPVSNLCALCTVIIVLLSADDTLPYCTVHYMYSIEFCGMCSMVFSAIMYCSYCTVWYSISQFVLHILLCSVRYCMYRNLLYSAVPRSLPLLYSVYTCIVYYARNSVCTALYIFCKFLKKILVHIYVVNL